MLITYNEFIAIDRPLNIVVSIPSLNSSLLPHLLHPNYYMFWLRMHLHRCSAFLQALLGKTYHNSPKTYKSDKQSILLQNFARATHKLKNKGVGVPSSYMSNCIRPRVVALLSWPFASSKVAIAYNNSKGIQSTFESFKHPTSDNGK